MDKKEIHLKVDPGDESMTLRAVVERISELQAQYPDREVFWDGDEHAICSRAKR